MGGCNFGNILPINVPKDNRGEFNFFDKKLSKSTSTFSIEPGLYISITDIVEAINTVTQERNNHNETCITVKVSRRTQKLVIMLANASTGLAFCSTDWGDIFGNNVGNEFGILMIGKGPHEPKFAYDIVRIRSLQHCWRHKSSPATMLSFYLKATGRRHYNNWTVHELSDIQ